MEHNDPAGLVFFDIDGTLVPGTSSSLYLAEHLGHRDELARAEAAYASGELTNHEVCEIDAKGWTGHSPTHVKNLLADLPLVDGIEETVTWCRTHRLIPALATLAWDPVGRHLRDRFGFHAHCGPTLEHTPDHYTGHPATTFDEHDKRDFALTLAHTLGLPPTHCAAIGDSRSDHPLFTTVSLSIAFNADPPTRTTATTSINSPDLRAIIPTLIVWLDARSPLST